MSKSFSVIFDNGGGTTLQTEDGFCHHYDNPTQAAEDVKALLDGGDTSDWDGNEPAGRMEYDYDTERNGGYIWHDDKDVRKTIKRGTLDQNDSGHGWGNAENFYDALGVTVAE